MFTVSPFAIHGQTATALPLVPAAQTITHVSDDCGVFTLQTVSTLSFKQRVCLSGRELISPRFALRAALMSAFGQFADSPHLPKPTAGEFAYRFGVYYSRRTARDAAVVLTGYIHKEDPRFRKSLATSFWRRTDSAFLNVLTSPDADGHLRPAYAPIAGSLSSAFVGSIMYRHQETLQQTLIHAAGAYGFYFLRSWAAEFKSDLISCAHRLMHGNNN